MDQTPFPCLKEACSLETSIFNMKISHVGYSPPTLSPQCFPVLLVRIYLISCLDLLSFGIVLLDLLMSLLARRKGPLFWYFFPDRSEQGIINALTPF